MVHGSAVGGHYKTVRINNFNMFHIMAPSSAWRKFFLKDEHRTSNIEWWIMILLRSSNYSNIEWKTNIQYQTFNKCFCLPIFSHSMFDIHLFSHSTFDVERSMFDVHSFRYSNLHCFVGTTQRFTVHGSRFLFPACPAQALMSIRIRQTWR